MKKLVAVPALVLAAVFVAGPSSAATTKMNHVGKWAWMAAGKKHQLGNRVPIVEADGSDWDTHALVKLTDAVPPGQCQWKDHVPPNLVGAKLFIQTDTPGKPQLTIVFADKAPIVRDLAVRGATASSWTWLETKAKDDWTYYVFFENNDGVSEGKPMEKRYRVEIFPPDNEDKVHCDPERPDNAITVASATPATKAHPCQTGGGSGNEPNH